MLTLLFYIAVLYVAVRMLIWGFKAAWGIARIVAFVILLPFFLIGLALSGLFTAALIMVILVAIFTTTLALIR